MTCTRKYLLTLILAGLLQSVFANPVYDSAIPAIKESLSKLSDEELAETSSTINGTKYIVTTLDDVFFVSIVTPEGNYQPIAKVEFGSLPYPAGWIEDGVIGIKYGYAHHGVYDTEYKFKLKNGAFYLSEMLDFANTSENYNDPSIQILTLILADLEKYQLTSWHKRFTIYKNGKEYEPSFSAWSKAMNSYKQNFTLPDPPDIATKLPKQSFALDGFDFDGVGAWINRTIAKQQNDKPALVEAGQPSQNILKIVASHFGLEHFDYQLGENGGLIDAGVCKPSAMKQQEAICVFIYGALPNTEKKLLLVLIDQQINQVVASYAGKNFDAPDGVAELNIDTARYSLSNSVRAFGVDLQPIFNVQCYPGGVGANRTLYIQEGKALKPVLHTPSMSSWSYVNGMHPGCEPYSEEQTIENTQLAIEMADSATNGYRDIVISATSSRTDGKPTGKNQFRHKLHYDGQKYPTQELEAAFYKWSSVNDEP